MLNVNELIYGGIPIALLNLSIVEFLKKFFENNKLIWIFALTIGIIEGIVLFSPVFSVLFCLFVIFEFSYYFAMFAYATAFLNYLCHNL